MNRDQESSTPSSLADSYVLGSSDAEHARLIKQGCALREVTERLLRDSGIGLGQRVLDVGAGIGDVSLLLARLVGERGSICAIDKDVAVLAKARARAAAAAYRNIVFLEGDLNCVELDREYDAIVGRFVLMFLPATRRARILESLARALKPGGVAVFQEPSWHDYFANAMHLPLHTECGHLICDTFLRAGAEINMALPLHRSLIQAGLQISTIRVDVPLATLQEDPDWTADLFASLKVSMHQLDIEHTGSTVAPDLHQRLRRELRDTQSFAPMVGLVGVIAQKPHTVSSSAVRTSEIQGR
jgi:SAM-dependent methyltransferase